MKMFLCCAVLLSFFLSPSKVHAEKPWSDVASVHWSNIPLGTALSRFAAVQKIGILLDRRIDPSLPLNFEASNQSLETILQRLTASFDRDYCFAGSTVYIGSTETVVLLPALFAEIRREIQKLPTWQSTVFRRSVSLEISFLSEPKIILQHLAKKNRLRWTNLEILPHDLWDEKKLPNVPLYELLTLLLVGFDLSFQIEKDGQTLTLIPFSERKLTPVQEPTFLLPVMQTERSPAPLTLRRFSLKAEQQPLDVLLNMFAQRLDLTLNVDKKSLEAKGVAANTRVSFEVKNAPAPELFRAVLKPLQLEFRIKGNSVTVW